MKEKFIGIFQEKFDASDENEVIIDYVMECVLPKEDFDNGTNNGYEGFFTTAEDTKNFIICGENHELPCDENDNLGGLTREEIKLMDSLEEGDVIVFDVDLYVECHYGEYNFYSHASEISNIEKYDDKYAADEIRLMVSEMPSYFD